MIENFETIKIVLYLPGRNMVDLEPPVMCHMSLFNLCQTVRVCDQQFSHNMLQTRQSQGLLYKQLCDYFIDSFSQWAFPCTALRRRHARTKQHFQLKNRLLMVIKNFLSPEGHQTPISGSKVTAILLQGWILPTGRASSGRV